MMQIKEVIITESDALELSRFKEMDNYAVENYDLPIELMMENAGLQLANLVASNAERHSRILVGVGNGNNGGGGLVAARRLAAWGYTVHLDLSTEISKELPQKQLVRAIKFGVKDVPIENPDIWIDAYLGFSQRLPLGQKLLQRINEANDCNCLRISLDIPTGYLGETTTRYFKADKILSLAAAKKILYWLPSETEIYIADLGIPKAVYEKYGIKTPTYKGHNILRVQWKNKD